MKKYFVTGIGTEIGKTVASAVLVEKLKADYWKPIQSGELENSDSIRVKNLISNTKTIIHPEIFRLNTPASPHLSAQIDGVEIKLKDFKLPDCKNHLIVEGAGGIFVPINSTHTILDLIEQLQLETIVVSKNYLGSINHTILSIEALKNRGIPIKGLLFNGTQNVSSEQFIQSYCKVPILGHIPEMSEINTVKITHATQFVSL